MQPSPLTFAKDTRQPSLSRGCRLRRQTNLPTVLLIPEGLMKLSPTGLRIVELCDGKRTVAEIVCELQTQFSGAVAGRIALDTQNFITNLINKRVLSVL